MKSRILIALLCGLSGAVLFAQVAADPNDFFYTDLSVWEASGIVNGLPPARPYPQQLVREILTTVIERGDAEQRRLAFGHWHRIFGKPFTWGFRTELGFDNLEMRRQIGVAIAFDINLTLHEYLTASASIDGWAVNKLRDDEILPEGTESEKDTVKDDAKVGPMWILPSVNSSIGVGTSEYYLNAGLMRGSFGPIHSNGVIAGPQALHAGQYSFAVNEPLWGLNMTLYGLSANNGYGTDYALDARAILEGKVYPSKYLSVHTIDWKPLPIFSVSILEGVMYGGRIEPLYLLPLSPFMISQAMTGFSDNNYLGTMFTYKPITGLKIDGVVYADDLSFNDIARLDFDTKWRLAAQAAVTWASPKSGMFTLASADYTILTPYAYSHKNGNPMDLEQPNYQNYMHYGNAFGAALEPNSDRFNLKIKLRPMEGVDFDVVGMLIRHGNVNESMEWKLVQEYMTQAPFTYTDGSILNPSGTIKAGHAWNEKTPFLSQDTLQYIWQTGFDAACRLPVLKSGGYMVFKFSYRLEYNYNSGINAQVYYYDKVIGDGEGHLDTGVTEKMFKDAARKQLRAWKENAHGRRIDNYVSAGFEYFF